MDNEIEISTSSGGIGKMFGRMVTNENGFLNTYEAKFADEIAFSSKIPGSILAIVIRPGKGLIIQKGSFLASFGDVHSEVYLQKKLGGGFFGGEGFLMRKYTGSGIVFLEINGSAHEYDIADADCKIVDTGYVAAMSDNCSMDIVQVKGRCQRSLWRCRRR